MGLTDVFNKKPESNEVKPDAKPPEKSQAELIAESLKATLPEVLKPLQDKLGEFEVRLTEATRKPEPKVEPKSAPSVFDDEDAAFATRMTPMFQRQLEFEARIEKQNVIAEYREMGFSELLKQYAKEIDDAIDNAPLVTNGADGQPRTVRGSRAYISNCIDMILGRAARQGNVRFKESKFFLEDASGSADNGKSSPSHSYSAKQVEAFKRMGITPERAAEIMSKAEVV